jgi:hypothetical protein
MILNLKKFANSKAKLLMLGCTAGIDAGRLHDQKIKKISKGCLR